jgi:glycosyltransferase involved in cell wall biosynthesis
MKILFAHQNFPGQYLHLARYLGNDPKNQVVFITQRTDAVLPGVRKILYKPHRPVTKGVHHYLGETEAATLNGQAVARCALDLRSSGFIPDVMLGHNGWGEIWYLKDVFPNVPLLGYFEFFYRMFGADVGFDKQQPIAFDTAPRVRTKNIGNLLALEAVDWGQTPTHWQRSVYPSRYHPIISVAHEGINTGVVRPDRTVRLLLGEPQEEFKFGEPIVTYVARNLEPYRGFPTFMRALPDILNSRPDARILVVGGDETSYGPRPPKGETFRGQMTSELRDDVDWSRVHFLGKVPYSTFLKILQVSAAHVYLTYPFVLSWSMLEAMAAGCVVVGSDTQPVTEVIEDRKNGLLVDFFDPTNVAKSVVEVLSNPKDFDVMRTKARETIVTKYDLAKVCLPAHLTLLEKLRR